MLEFLFSVILHWLFSLSKNTHTYVMPSDFQTPLRRKISSAYSNHDRPG